MVELEMREGGPPDDRDAERYGYWTIIGPQDEDEVYGTIERAKNFDTGVVFFSWNLRRRTSRVHNSTTTYWTDIARGDAATTEEALAELRIVWQRDVGEDVLGMPQLAPEIELPWRDL